jgi:hypothetical protein
VCIEREKEIFATMNSTECSCAALQLVLLLVLAGKKKMYLCILMIHVRIEREKKNLVQFPIDFSCAALQQLLLLLYCLEKNFYLCILMIKIGLYINGILKFWGISNFEASSHCLNDFKDGPGLITDRGREKSGESEENRERDVEEDTYHVYIKRKKEIFAIVNSTECSCAALQLLLLLVLVGKKKSICVF